MSKRMGYVLVIALLIGAASTLHAKEKPVIPVGPSVTKGDPPPGNAMSMSMARAWMVLKQTLRGSFVGEMKNCSTELGPKYCYKYDFSSPQVWLYADGFDFQSEETWSWNEGKVYKFVTKVHVDFNMDQDYIASYHEALPSCSGSPCYSVHRTTPLKRKLATPDKILAVLLSCSGDCKDDQKLQDASSEYLIVNWAGEENARRFADAFNRLVYGVHRGEPEPEPMVFSSAAAAWRAMNPKPPLSTEADREWILAENAVKEKNLDSATEHYEAALEIQPAWPTGWFDLAMIYAEQQNFADAADAMKHYLELAPDAPDAKDAHTQMIIWEDKASKPQ